MAIFYNAIPGHSRGSGVTSQERDFAIQYGYPPDLQDAAVQTVLQQAEALSTEWMQA
jgi:hypothetical protein